MKNNIFQRLQAKRYAVKQAEILHRELIQRLYAFIADANVDVEVHEVIDDLVNRLRPLKSMDTPIDLDLPDVVAFMGDNRGVIFGTLDAAKREAIELDVEKLKHKQFASFAENMLYTQGTNELLEILTRYHRIETDNGVVIAMPDSHTYSADKATIELEDLRDPNMYDKSRAIYVAVIFNTGFMMFGFEEQIR
jgi:hypothetical protein